MSTMADGGGGRFQRFATALAHYQPAILTGGVAADLVMRTTGAMFTTAGAAMVLVLAFTVMCALLSESYHSRRLCERCGSRVPLDGGADAERNARWLRFSHFGHRVSVLLVITSLVVAFVILPEEYRPYSMYPLYLFWAIHTTANLIHRPLEPWCPQCRWGDGGDAEDLPVPPPVPEGTGRNPVSSRT